jgi:hypothetical protein
MAVIVKTIWPSQGLDGGRKYTRVECQQWQRGSSAGPSLEVKGRKIMRIVVREIVSARGRIPEEWQQLHDLITPILARGEEVELDFAGSDAVCTPLLRTALGPLLKDHPLEKVKSLLRPLGLDELYRQTLETVLEQSSRYYTDPRFREVVDRAAARMFEDQ